MPAINVARTDTFEVQRQKINAIGANLFSISAGGSDLSTGILKLGDGTQAAPSLAFTSDATLGIFKPEANTIGFVSNSKKIFDFDLLGVNFYSDVTLEKKSVFDGGSIIGNSGSNYDVGTYTNISLSGGSGSGAVASIDVAAFTGTVNNVGSNYYGGSFTNVPLQGGNGTGALASFTTTGIDGSLTNAGLAYVPGTYTNVPLTGGTGSGATADINIIGGSSFGGTISNAGTGYTDGTYPSVQLLNQPTTTYTVTLVGGVYALNGNSQQAINLEQGNTYRFDISDSSMSTEFFNIRTTDNNNLGSPFFSVRKLGSDGTAGSFVEIVVADSAPVQQVKYTSQINGDIGALIDIVSGTPGQGGIGATATIVVSGGIVTSYIGEDYGSGYDQNDILEVYNGEVGTTGSGFEYTVGTLTYSGQVNSVTITDPGNGYSQFDPLSANDSDLGGGGGSGFEYTITEESPNTFSDFQVTNTGSGYQLNDTLTLESSIGNFTTSFGFETDIVISDVTGIQEGFRVVVVSGPGQLPAGTTVTSVDTGTNTLGLSDAATVTGSATVRFEPAYGGDGNFSYTINNFGGVESVTITDGGNGYQAGDALTVNPADLAAPIPYTVSAADFSLITFTGSYPANEFTVGEILNNKGGVVSSVNINSSSSIPRTTINQSSVTVTAGTNTVTMSSTAGIVQGMEVVQNNVTGGTIVDPATVVSVDSGTQVTLSGNSVETGTANLTFLSDESATYTGVSASNVGGGGGITLNGRSVTFDVQRNTDGSVLSVVVNSGGFFYEVNNGLLIDGADVGGTSGTDDISLTVASVTGELQDLEVFAVNTSGGNLDSILITRNETLNNVSGNPTPTDILVKSTNLNVDYNIATTDHTQMRFLIDSGSGAQLTPNLTLYLGDVYAFDVSDTSMSDGGHVLKFSEFRDGPNSPSSISLSTNLFTQTTSITVSDTTGVLPGMAVTTGSGDGSVALGTLVESVPDATTIILDRLPILGGATALSFNGVPYEDGITIDGPSILLEITESTPTTLYYYCENHVDMGGADNNEAVITVDSNNPRTFGSGFSLSISGIESVDSVAMDIESGSLTADSFVGQTASLASGVVSGNWEVNGLKASTAQVNVISSTTGLSLSSSSINLDGLVAVGSNLTLASTTGNITTTGEIKTTNILNVSDKIKIFENEIQSTSGTDLIIKPFLGSLAKVDSTGAFVIPSGNISERPGSTQRQDGAVRYNTETYQYEGYSQFTGEWSSLGGVRDVDGNTYITAEESVGNNDNKIWFYNDSSNTIRVTTTHLEFVNAKKVKSINVNAPAYTEWTANTPVTAGNYLKYKNNIYEVISSGTTGTSGNEPTDTTGTTFGNGTAFLQYSTTAVSTLTFDEITSLNVDPQGTSPLIVNGQLKLQENKILSNSEDIVLKAFGSKKVKIDNTTSLVIPVGDSNSKGSPEQGSIRYNTTDSQFEGYNGAQWGGLGGVKDIDQDTEIKAETGPGNDEDTLYFFNNGNNTLRLTETSLDFDTIDTITSVGSNALNIDAATVTFNSLDTTLDNSSATNTLLLSAKDNLDFGLSSGLTTDHLVRLTNTGDVVYNLGFGTGTPDNITLLDSVLRTVDLNDVKYTNTRIVLERGVLNSGNTTVYNTSTEVSSKLIISVLNITTGDKEISEFLVIHKGSDIFFTETNMIRTGATLVSTTFDFDPNSNVRASFAADTGLTVGDELEITVVNTITKR